MNPVLERDFREMVGSFEGLDKLASSTVLITGANSLLGKYLIHFLMTASEVKGLNTTVVASVRTLGTAQKNFADYIQRDDFVVLNQDACDPIEYEGRVDYIVHAAGFASAYHIVNHPTQIMKVNTLGTINVLEFAKTQEVRNILFTSTREIYGTLDDGVLNITEDTYGTIDPLEARSCYPESKRAAEALFEAYRSEFGIPYSVARIAHVYGPTMTLENDGRVMSDFISYAVKGEDFALNSDGTAVRAFCYITDAVRGMVRILLDGKSGEAYNLANEREPKEIKDVALLLIEQNKEKDLELKLNQGNALSSGGYLKAPIVSLDTSKLEALGWEPLVSLEEGLKRTVAYFHEEASCSTTS